MSAKQELFGDYDDIMFCLGSSLRYALGRKSYAVGLVAGVITKNIPLLNQKWLINCIRDIDDYIGIRERWSDREHSYDNHCDLSTWLNLKQALIDGYEEKNFDEPLELHGIRKTLFHLFFEKGGKKQLVGTCSTVDAAYAIITGFCEARGFAVPYLRGWEKDGVLNIDSGSHTEFFKLELKDIARG